MNHNIGCLLADWVEQLYRAQPQPPAPRPPVRLVPPACHRHVEAAEAEQEHGARRARAARARATPGEAVPGEALIDGYRYEPE